MKDKTVAILESRARDQVASLIRKHGGTPFQAPALAEIALKFSSFEYFWLVLMGLTCAVFLTSEHPLKGFVSLFLGLLAITAIRKTTNRLFRLAAIAACARLEGAGDP